ncbi:plasmid recombination protein [Vibrio hannami]|uniref:plasmid recombination protein n=1 Tax=Vibrio hannami TaxID=2717094 RepID=UPI00240EA437|nr:plasmid recombination protein [Vibrio hannami]MDG3088813.1 plasmid recombination protein [Vibrio hannami]
MNSYQLIHLEIYNNNPSKPAKPSMYCIVNEAMRVDRFCPHVYQPQTPEILFGLDPRKLPDIAIERSKMAKDKKGRKVRKDAPLLLAGVISIPAESDIDFKKFLSLSLRFLKHTYGQNLASVVLHLDESHPHLHFYAIPSLKDGGFSMAEIHPGIKARSECVGKGYSEKANAYKQAMRGYQDMFYAQVGSKLGMTRLGPRVQRLTRKQWKAQQAQAQALSAKHFDLIKRQRKINAIQKSVEAAKNEIQQREIKLTQIEKSAFFQNKEKMKNDYLRKCLSNSEKELAHFGEHAEGLEIKNSAFLKELKTLRKDNESYQRKFDAMSYKLSLKDEYILKLKQQRRDNNHEKANSTYTSNYYSY